MPTSPPTIPAHGLAKSLTSGRSRRTQAATVTGIQSSSSAPRRQRVGAAKHEPGAHRAEREAVAAGDQRQAVAEQVVELGRRERPERAAGDQQEQRRDRAEASLELGDEERHRHADHEQVAEVVVDERRREVVPPLVDGRDSAQRPDPEQAQVRGALDQHQERRGRGSPRSSRRGARRRTRCARGRVARRSAARRLRFGAAALARGQLVAAGARASAPAF